MAMVYNEWYGEIPLSLLRLIKRHNVTPAEFQMLEMNDLSHEDMENVIKSNLRNGQFDSVSYMQG